MFLQCFSHNRILCNNNNSRKTIDAPVSKVAVVDIFNVTDIVVLSSTVADVFASMIAVVVFVDIINVIVALVFVIATGVNVVGVIDITNATPFSIENNQLLLLLLLQHMLK